ncbi:MAG: nuclear transport factor 2 family protein [Roseivirga sp.]|nr:nuclear transport factor 2 family protein [Roseivirga sp.]
MKKVLTCLLVLALAFQANAQNSESEKVKRACMDYIEGFYEGDEAKLKRSLSPDLLKFGYMKKRGTEEYASAGQMTYEEALSYARNVKEKQRFPKADAPRGVEIYDVDDNIAAAKVTAWWGFDYMLLAKVDGKWMIQQVLWQGPLKKKGGS